MYLVTVGITHDGYTHHVFKLAHDNNADSQSDALEDTLLGYPLVNGYMELNKGILSLDFILNGKTGSGWIVKVQKLKRLEWEMIQKLQINS